MKAYIYNLFKDGELIDQTSIDEKNEELAWKIMVDDENRNDEGLNITFIGEVDEE